MMENALNILEFKKFLRLASDFSHSEASEDSILKIRPFNNRLDIEKRFARISEIKKMADEGNSIRLSRFSDISYALGKIKPAGAVLEGYDLSKFMPVLSVINEISEQIGQTEGLIALSEITTNLTGFPIILNTLQKSLDSEGNILDSASDELSAVRGRIRRLEGRIRKKLEEMVRDENISVFLQDDFITSRYGRWVIPVRMDSKGQVPGVVHDISRSGETAFIEPREIMHISNELENLMAEQKAEEIRILRNISSKIREALDEINKQYDCIVHLDVLCSIVKASEMLRMNIPQINESGIINLINGRHPLLTVSLQKTEMTGVVPLDVRLGTENSVMVITGSNAGGKTIAIKTIGILLAMALSGMPVPADSSSSFPVIEKLLIDIGDAQSIENNLSTFSAHISNINEIIAEAGDRTLILIDELGTGTDPDEGAALASAVLKELRDAGALVFATTHLTEIKGFVHRTEGMINASMEFDQKTLTPLYKLRIGEPGLSHALEIAKRYGLPENIINYAKELMGGAKVELENLIADLNQKRIKYENALSEMEYIKSEIEAKNAELEKMRSQTEYARKEILANAYKDASDIVSDIKRQMFTLLDEAKKRGREQISDAIRQSEHVKDGIDKNIKKYEMVQSRVVSINEIIEGDMVFVRSLGYDAPVIEVNLKHDRVKVSAAGKEVEVPASDIEIRKGKYFERKKSNADIIDYDKPSSSQINVIGLRVDESLSRLEYFLNQASLDGLDEVVVIHGVGAGILLKAVREHLKGHPLVKGFTRGKSNEGGEGITIVSLN